jgi:hypothetical protein
MDGFASDLHIPEVIVDATSSDESALVAQDESIQNAC